MTETIAGLWRTLPLLKHGRRATLWVMALALALPLAAGCSEWHKYWDRSPTGPVVLRDITPPSVRLLSPSGPDSAHASPVTGAAYAVVLEATDDVGVARVEVHVDGLPAAQVPGPPWEFPWNTTGFEEGSCHLLWATAADRAGNVAVSDTVYARVFNAGPAVVLTEPADGARVRESIPITAQIAGAAGDIEKVEFLADAGIVGTLTAPPWTLALDTGSLTPGDHFISARATTRLGAVGVSPAVRIRVNNGVPLVSIDFPPDGHRVATQGTLILSGTASDLVEGPIPPDRFTWRSDRDGAIGAGRYFRIRDLSVGTHTITASAENAWGVSNSASIQVVVLARPTYGFCCAVYAMALNSCLACHQPGTLYYPTSQLNISTYSRVMAGGITRIYESVVPCRPESSLVWNKVTAATPWVGIEMPPREGSGYPVYAPPADTSLNKLRTWILEGAAPYDTGRCIPPWCK